MKRVLLIIVTILLAFGINFAQISVPTGVEATGYESHIDITWNANPESNILGYYIYKLQDTTYKRIAIATSDIRIYDDFLEALGDTATYAVSAFDSDYNESGKSATVTAFTHSMTDDQLLTMLEEATFRYFWDYAHPVSGLARERLGSGETVTIGGSGFGVMAILVGIERGFITRDQGIQRMLKILNFLSTKADRFHGAFPHWMNGTTGKVIPFSTYDDGGDLVETSFMMEGLLTARQYFNQSTVDEDSIRIMITNLWQSVEYDWYQRDNTGYTLYWHWSPDYGWMMNMPIRGYNEAMIVYLLAIASPTHSVPKYDFAIGWSGFLYANGKSFYGIPLYVGQDYGGPLFFAHYSFLGFDPRSKKDKFTNYFINNRNQTLINRAYCIANPNHYAGYDSVTWGLTASDDPSGYDAHSPTNDNGTITPSAAISSMPYTPVESIAAFKNMYLKYGKNIWGPFGFKDAFNVSKNWYASSYISIDEGPIIDMIENYRSQLLWKNFMANPEIQPMLDSVGFVPDNTDVINSQTLPKEFVLEGNYPNPFNPSTTIKFELPRRQNVELNIYNMLGDKVRTLVNNVLSSGENKIVWDGKDDNNSVVSSGVYIYTLRMEDKIYSGKMILLK
ncbi:MAG: T9SS type A sorting domain-containing protein [Bacteroidetes bacterium]|nr:T9SS type A sorting domain-containing protein [Bacteroidota bacterium]